MTDALTDHWAARGGVLATLVAATGGSSRRIGARMVVRSDGEIVGGVTIGGCVDAQVIAAADALMIAGERRLLSIALDDDDAWEIGLTCGGTVDVLLEPLPAHSDDHPAVIAERAAERSLAAGNATTIITPLVGSRATLAVDDLGARAGSIGSAEDDDAIAAAIRAAEYPASGVQTLNTPHGAQRFFVERRLPAVSLAIVGATDVARTLVSFASTMSMRTIVIDGRERFLTSERFPTADSRRVGVPSEIVASLPLTPHTCLVLLAHDYKYELPVLRNVLRADVGYIGLLGSKRRAAAVRDLLREEGFNDAELARIHTPIGLDLGGKAAEEIALSILAEIVAVRNGKRA